MSPAVRWAADTSGGVIERPAQAFTPFEQERWELPVISWLAAEAEAPALGTEDNPILLLQETLFRIG